MKQWIIPVSWRECGVVYIEAKTLTEAIEIAKDVDGTIPLPEGEYLDDSWTVDYDDEIEYIRSIYNDNQKDEVTLKTKQEIYDEMCGILTQYENSNDMITEHELYDMLVKIQNNWEAVITVQED